MAKSRDSRAPTEPLGLDSFGKPAETAGLSLDQLSAAFAEMLQSGDDPYTEPKASADPAADELLATADEAPVADACEITPQSILEAMLFVGGQDQKPLNGQQIARLMRGVRPAEIDALVRELNAAYAARNCPYQIASEGAGYRLRLVPEFARLRERFYGKARQARLSQAAIDVLAIVAYNQPLPADEINRLRGMASGPILSHLVRRELLKLAAPAGKSQRRQYVTTPRFLELFGLTSLDDLPSSQELDRS